MKHVVPFRDMKLVCYDDGEHSDVPYVIAFSRVVDGDLRDIVVRGTRDEIRKFARRFARPELKRRKVDTDSDN